MAQARKDNKGRALRKGETQRKYDLMVTIQYLVEGTLIFGQNREK